MVSQLAPEHKTTEFYGFLSVAGRTSTFIGPFVFGGAISYNMHNYYIERGGLPELLAEQNGQLWGGIGSILLFLIVGMLILFSVREVTASNPMEYNQKNRRNKMKVLITGGAGYIGSTIASVLLDAGHTPIILDSLITGRREFTRDRIFYEADIADRAMVRRVFSDHPDIVATIHCAALIVVPESVSRPYEYYRENVVKSMEFFKTLSDLGFPKVVFSSSAAVYDVVPRLYGYGGITPATAKPVFAHEIHDGDGAERFLPCLQPERHRPALFQPDRFRPPKCAPGSIFSTPAT